MAGPVDGLYFSARGRCHPRAAGYVAVKVDNATETVKVMWVKPGPADRDLIQRLAKEEGVVATIEHASRSRTEPAHLASRAFALSEAKGIQLNAFHGITDGGGDPVLEIQRESSLSGLQDGLKAEASRIAMIESILSTQLGSDIDVALAQGEVAPAASRGNGVSPFAAGSFIVGAGYCTTGFSFQYSGVNRASTARHCTGNAKGYFHNVDSKVSFGVRIRTSADGAILLGGRGSGYMFDGGAHSSSTRGGGSLQ